MQKTLRSILSYALLGLAGLTLGFAGPRAMAWLKPGYEVGNYAQYFPDQQTEVVIYSTTWCQFCAKTRAYFAARHIKVYELDIEHSELGKGQHARLGGGGIPKVIIGTRKITGFAPDKFDAALVAMKISK